MMPENKDLKKTLTKNGELSKTKPSFIRFNQDLNGSILFGFFCQRPKTED